MKPNKTARRRIRRGREKKLRKM
jgi:hypothetical protein